LRRYDNPAAHEFGDAERHSDPSEFGDTGEPNTLAHADTDADGKSNAGANGDTAGNGNTDWCADAYAYRFAGSDRDTKANGDANGYGNTNSNAGSRDTVTDSKSDAGADGDGEPDTDGKRHAGRADADAVTRCEPLEFNDVDRRLHRPRDDPMDCSLGRERLELGYSKCDDADRSDGAGNGRRDQGPLRCALVF
jgi:hypothetical protein